MTFSIAARCEETGMFGMAVSSSSPAVAARCAFARAGVGAAASQNITDPDLGTRCLDLMELGASAQQALDAITRTTPNIEYRQLTAVDRDGSTATFSGSRTLGTHATAHARNVVCAGNLLSSTRVPQVMVDGFVAAHGHLADRLIAGMQAGVNAGGEEGPVHSAGLLVVDRAAWPVASLRVDWIEHGDPIEELARIWAVYSPQLDDYVTRAADPSRAPRYGVPGDE